MSFTISEGLQFLNLLLIPIGIYIVKLERQLAVFGEWKQHTDKTIEDQKRDIDAAHRRLDRHGAPAAARDIKP